LPFIIHNSSFIIPPFHHTDLINWENKSLERQKLYRRFLDKAETKNVLKQLPALHEEAFEKIDCLKCANCCRNYSPRFKTPDIKRISKQLRMRESDFINTYLKLDDDGDYVAQTAPCPFLGPDNFCSIYDDRPSDCVRFPYTNEDVMIKRKHITLKNSSFCPIVYFVLEKLVEQQ
jgi:Fe-S-cluster containining protein